jgi:hypothetical protein
MNKEQFEIGMTIVINNGYGYGLPYSFGVVDHVTETQLSLTDGDRYMLRSGEKLRNHGSYHQKKIAHEWSSNDLTSVEKAEQCNEEWQKEQDKRKLIDDIKTIRLNEISNEDFEFIANILKKYLGDKK